MITPIPLATLLLVVPSLALAGAAHDKRQHRGGGPRRSRSASASVAAATSVQASPATATTLPVTSEAAAAASTPVATVVTSEAVAAAAGTWTLKETMIGTNFLDSFNFETFDDPTHGTVDYVGAAEAASLNLTFASESTFVMRTDFSSVVAAGARGRKSVRLASKNTYTAGVTIVTLSHMPTGCGTWPAFWTVGTDWPNNGEIDIIEGANNDVNDLSSLHASATCTMPSSGRDMTGTAQSLTCTSGGSDNTGCGVLNVVQPNSYGAGFNNVGGGTYAMRRNTDAIKIWFWPVGTVPADVASGASTIDESTWGTATAVFPTSSTCDLASHFGAHNIVINISLCGDWAGATYASDSSCPSTCDDHVRNSPSSFTDAFFEIQSLRTYA